MVNWIAKRLRAATVVGLLGLMTFVGASSPVQGDHPEFHSYADIQAVVNEWASMGATIDVAATSDEGRDVYLVSLGTGPFTIMYLAGLHANEPGSTEGFVRFMYALLGDVSHSFKGPLMADLGPDTPVMAAVADPALRAELLSKVTIIGFPMMDPDGVEDSHTRKFQGNVDYTTNVTHFTHAIRYAQAQHTVDLMLDSHGAPIASRGLDITIGLVEPMYTPQPVLNAARHNAETAWRSIAAAGGAVGYFEELLTVCEMEPCTSVGEVYWAGATRFAMLTQSSMQVTGIPSFYTESSGLSDGVPAILRGASATEVLMLALAFENAGMLDGTAPHSLDGGVAGQFATEGADVLQWTPDSTVTHLLATVQLDGLSRLDRSLALFAGDTELARDGASSEDLVGAGSSSRAVAFDTLAPGNYRFESSSLLDPTGTDTYRFVWRQPDAAGSQLGGIIDQAATPAFCWEWTSLYREAVSAVDGRMASESC